MRYDVYSEDSEDSWMVNSSSRILDSIQQCTKTSVDKEGSQFQWKSSETFKNFLKFKQNPIKLYSILIIFTFFFLSLPLALIFLINSREFWVHYVLMQLDCFKFRAILGFQLKFAFQRLYLTRRIEPNVINIHIIVNHSRGFLLTSATSALP